MQSPGRSLYARPSKAQVRLWGAFDAKTQTTGKKTCRFAVSYQCLLLVLALVLSAFLIGLAMRSAQHAWVAWVGIAPLLIAVRSLSPAKAAAAGMTWGLCILLSSFVLQDIDAGLPLTALSMCLMAVVPAVYGWLGATLTRRVGFNPLLLALGWIGVEFALRPLELPEGLLPATQRASTLGHLVASVLGYSFVGFLIVLTNGILLRVASSRRCCLPSLGLPPVWRTDDFVLLTAWRDNLQFVSHHLHVSDPRAPPDVSV